MAGETVLIVDDNPANLKLVRVILAGAGYDVHVAADAEEAMDVLARVRPKLVLMDIQLPGVDGLELTRRLRADPRWADLTIVGLTAYAMKGDEERALAAGCDGYVTKPIDTRRFAGQVAEILEGER